MKRAHDDCLRAEVQHEEIWKEDGIQESLGNSENWESEVQTLNLFLFFLKHKPE